MESVQRNSTEVKYSHKTLININRMFFQHQIERENSSKQCYMALLAYAM